MKGLLLSAACSIILSHFVASLVETSATVEHPQTPAPAILRVYLLDGFRLEAEREAPPAIVQPRLQFLLAYLLLHRDRPISRQQLAFAFWPDTSDEQARNNLRNLLHRLREALPAGGRWIVLDRQTIRWQSDATWYVDVAEFEAALARAQQASQEGKREPEIQALTTAVELHAGDLLPDCYDDWIAPIRERLSQAALAASARLAVLMEAAGDYPTAIGHFQRLLRHDPLNEATYRELMRLHLANDDRAGALRVYHACATQLRRDLGVDPGPATQALHRQALQAGALPAQQVAPMPALPVLVGRQAEWAQLQVIWRRAAAGHPQFALLVGETGSGKTRLAEELIELVNRRQQITAAAHCLPTEQTLAYAPVAALLRTPALHARLLQLEPAWLAKISRLLPELHAIRPELTEPGPMTEPWQRQRLFQALTHAVLPAKTNAAGAKAATLLLVDDLQWCDPDTLDWLRYLLEHAAAAPLLVLATACCCELASDNPVETLYLNLERLGQASRIELPLLPGAAAAELAVAAAGRDLSPVELAYLDREAEGNPLFIIEMVRAGLDPADPGSRPREAAAEHTTRPGDDPLPPRVEAAIRRRLAELSPASRELAQTAAVIGRTFTVDVLAGISRLNEDALLHGLDELWRRRIIREQGATAYDFSHDKLRAVAYAGLSPMQRRSLHRRAAETLAALAATADGAGELAAQLAHHHLTAGDEQRALGYLVQAGDHARVMHAHQEAIGYYERAIALQRRLNRLDVAARTLMKLGLTYHHALDFPRARQAYETGFDLWLHASDARPGGLPTTSQTLRSHWGSLTTLDPGLVGDFNTVAIVEELFAGLADHGPDAEVAPALAASWDVEDGGRRYVFHLRRDLCWSDGAPLVAQDFEAAWRRVLHPETKASCANFLYDVRGARAYHNGEIADPSALGVLAVDDRTLVVELEQSAGYFPHLLANPVTYPIPRHVVATYGAAWTDPEHIVSNGPFVLEKWRRGERMILARNPRSSAPFSGNIQRVDLALENDAATVMAAYEADALDVVQLDYRFSVAERHAIRERHVSDLVSAPRFTTWFLGFDTERPPLNDLRVRRALALALDREYMAGAVLHGFATPATGGFTPPGMPGHVAGIGLPYDPATGRRLLAEAGYPAGRGLPTLTLTCEKTVADQAEFLLAQWQDHLGIAVALETVDWPTFVRRMEGERLLIYYSAWRADYPDPDNFLRVALQWRKTRWHDAVYKDLVERAHALTDPRARLAAYAQAERRLIEQAAIVPLNYRRSYFLIKPRIKRYPISGIRPWFWQDVLINPA